MSAATKLIPLKTEADTLDLGARLARTLRRRDIIALTGDLGAGKTTLARGCIQAICDVSEVPSPTYTLLQTYETEGFDLYHFDLYRLKAPNDAIELGIDDAIDFGVSLIEWPGRLGEFLPRDNLTIHIAFDGAGRVAQLKAGPGWEERLNDI